MLKNPDEKEVSALARLHNSPDGQILMAYLKRNLEALKDAMIACEGDTFRRLQGRAQESKEILDALEDAPAQFLKLQHRANSR